uniref:hypothetical protein n=1 Tax=Parerythrobacter lutipelagi TaxID=1964208 RepID=UPI001375723F|nr:hypothetical protein [Parerythrobacter lutipelagi]
MSNDIAELAIDTAISTNGRSGMLSVTAIPARTEQASKAALSVRLIDGDVILYSRTGSFVNGQPVILAASFPSVRVSAPGADAEYSLELVFTALDGRTLVREEHVVRFAAACGQAGT